MVLSDISNSLKFNWNTMTNISHSTSITKTSVTFSSAFSTKVFGVVLSNPPTTNHYGHQSNLTKSGFELHTSRISGGTALDFDYYSFAYGY